MVFKFFKNKLSKEKQSIAGESQAATKSGDADVARTNVVHNVDIENHASDVVRNESVILSAEENSSLANLVANVSSEQCSCVSDVVNPMPTDLIKNTGNDSSTYAQKDTLQIHNSQNFKTQSVKNLNTTNSSHNVSIGQEENTSWRERLFKGLSKTRDSLGKKVLGIFGGGRIDEYLYEELETALLSADIGVSATNRLLNEIRKKVTLKGLKDSNELYQSLKESVLDILQPLEKPLVVDKHKPCVIMLAGINGAGKTTTIGKLAKYYQTQGKSVMLAAGDTFRAAAREQLLEWGKRNNVTVVSQQGGDSAAVCFDAINSAKANKIDIVLADTAGRLPTQLNLMEEIKKVKRVIGKALDGAPHEVLLVLDANIGQNAINQVCAFDDALKLTGLVLTKLDGTAKGGVICAIGVQRPVPLRFVGVGESIDDLRPFVAKDYVDALL